MTNNGASPIGHANIVEDVRRRLELAHQNHQHRTLPFITVTYAQSLDGCIAGSNGETIRLSNPLSQKITHQLRATHDAIMVGINTIARDNPRLNVRLVDGPDPKPIVIDSQLRFPTHSKLLRDPCVRPIIIGAGSACEKRARRLLDWGAQIELVGERADGMLDLEEVFARLHGLGFRSVMVEGGASIITSMLTSDLADQYVLTISPRLVAGMRALKPQPRVGETSVARLHNVSYQLMGEDLVLRGDLKNGSHESTPTNGNHSVISSAGRHPESALDDDNGESH